MVVIRALQVMRCVVQTHSSRLGRADHSCCGWGSCLFRSCRWNYKHFPVHGSCAESGSLVFATLVEITLV